MNKGRRARPFLFASGRHGQRLGTPRRGRFASMTFERPVEGWLRVGVQNEVSGRLEGAQALYADRFAAKIAALGWP
jgi:hypothetical protein